MENKHLSIIQIIMEEGFGKSNLKVIDQYVSDSFKEHQFGGKNGKEGLKTIIRQLNAAFSDLQYVLQQSIWQGDTVWTHYRATGFQTGNFMNLPASGNQISIDVMDIFRFENDLLVEHWGIPDRFAVMMQLGILTIKEQVS